MIDKMVQEEADRREANRKTLGTLLVFSVLGAGMIGFCVTHTQNAYKHAQRVEEVKTLRHSHLKENSILTMPLNQKQR